MEQRVVALPTPTTIRPRAEFAAIVEPALRDIPDPPEHAIDGWEPFESQPAALESGREILEAVQRTAFADDRVSGLLEGKRYTVVGASRLLDHKDRGTPVAVMVLYSHTDERAYRVWLAGEGDDLRVEGVDETDEQPQASDEEIERAVELARGSGDVVPFLEDGFEAMALLTSAVEPGDRHYGRRRLIVGFGPPDERLPRVRALVDLGDETVMWVDSRRERPEREDA
jgi:hypothetical protein